MLLGFKLITMYVTYGNEKKTTRNIGVPLTDSEKNRIDLIKKTTGQAIGFWVREAILEKLEREGMR